MSSKHHEPDDDWKPPSHLKRTATNRRQLRKKTRRNWSHDEFAFLDEDSQQAEAALLSNHVNLLDCDSADDSDDKDDDKHKTRSQASTPPLPTLVDAERSKYENQIAELREELDLMTKKVERLQESNQTMLTTNMELEEKLHNAEERCTKAQDDVQRAANREMEMNHVLLRAPPLMDRYSTYRRTPPIAEHTYESISAYFMNNLVRHRKNPGEPHGEVPHLEIQHIELVSNPRLWNKYAAERDDIYGLCEGRAKSLAMAANFMFESGNPLVAPSTPTELNEFFLFHGAPHHLVSRLAQQGFDERYAGEHFGALFGKGVYFAHNASKSDIYTSPDADGVRAMFLSRVCLGEVQVVNSAQRNIWKPTERPDGRGPFNSVAANTHAHNGCVEYNEYIVYKGAQAYPEYIVFYKHKDGCACTHCKK